VAESGEIEGLLGPNLDGPEAGAKIAASEMLAAAVAVGAADGDPAVNRDASAFLRAQYGRRAGRRRARGAIESPLRRRLEALGRCACPTVTI
jgi:hypothetical protein